jgi:hypothetical protein
MTKPYRATMQTPSLNEKIDKIVTELGDAKDDVLALTDELCSEIWQKTDRRDVDSIRTGSERMIAAVNAVTAFQKSCEDIASTFRSFFPPPSAVASAPVQTVTDGQLELFRNRVKITLQDSWTYKRPFGFILQGKPYPWRRTWIDLYRDLACALRDRNAEVFSTLPDKSEFISNQGKRYIARGDSDLRIPMRLAEGVFAESNLNANLIRDNTERILDVFAIRPPEIEFYLR